MLYRKLLKIFWLLHSLVSLSPIRKLLVLIVIAVNLLAIHAKRITIMGKDFSTLRGIFRIFKSPATDALASGFDSAPLAQPNTVSKSSYKKARGAEDKKYLKDREERARQLLAKHKAQQKPASTTTVRSFPATGTGVDDGGDGEDSDEGGEQGA